MALVVGRADLADVYSGRESNDDRESNGDRKANGNRQGSETRRFSQLKGQREEAVVALELADFLCESHRAQESHPEGLVFHARLARLLFIFNRLAY
jgi:hypothetical protein